MTRCPKALVAAGVIAVAATHSDARSASPDQAGPTASAAAVYSEYPQFDRGRGGDGLPR